MSRKAVGQQGMVLKRRLGIADKMSPCPEKGARSPSPYTLTCLQSTHFFSAEAAQTAHVKMSTLKVDLCRIDGNPFYKFSAHFVFCPGVVQPICRRLPGDSRENP